MTVDEWPQIELQGKEFIIPRTCPNCLAPAANPMRTTYSRPRGVGGTTFYNMTFYYCDACAQVFREVQGVEKKIASIGHNMLAGWVLLAMLWILLLGVVIASELGGGEGPGLLVVTAGVGALGFFMSRRFYRKRTELWNRERPALPPNAVGYGFAAFLIQSRGFRTKTSTFAAARQEWIDLLGEANPGTP